MNAEEYGEILATGHVGEMRLDGIATFDGPVLRSAEIRMRGTITRADPLVKAGAAWVALIAGNDGAPASGVKLTVSDDHGQKFVYILGEHHEDPAGDDWYDLRWPD